MPFIKHHINADTGSVRLQRITDPCIVALLASPTTRPLVLHCIQICEAYLIISQSVDIRAGATRLEPPWP